MTIKNTHIITIDGMPNSGRKTLCFELSLILLYNNMTTAILVNKDSPLHQIIELRKQNYPLLPTPELINSSIFFDCIDKYDAILIINDKEFSELITYSSTYISIIAKTKTSSQNFTKDINYINNIWELKKQIASKHNKSLNWIVIENNTKKVAKSLESNTLQQFTRQYSFKNPSALQHRFSYKSNHSGLSSQDNFHESKKENLSYLDIITKREITRLAEFIFN